MMSCTFNGRAEGADQSQEFPAALVEAKLVGLKTEKDCFVSRDNY